MDKKEILQQSVELYKQGLSAHKVRKITNIGVETLYKYLREKGLIRSNSINSRKYYVDHIFFNIIDTEEKAYWLGFLYADGYITKAKYGKYIGISLGVKDESHLEKIKKSLNATYPIKTYNSINFGVETEYVRLLISSDQMFNDLIEKGLVERKSLVLKFPDNNIVPKNLVHHFIRGYFDGDGSFKKSQDSFYAFQVCGTKEFLNSLAIYIYHPNLKLGKRHKDKNNNNYSLEIGGRQQVIKIGDYMYKNATIYLDRKYQRYLDLINAPKNYSIN